MEERLSRHSTVYRQTCFLTTSDKIKLQLLDDITEQQGACDSIEVHKIDLVDVHRKSCFDYLCRQSYVECRDNLINATTP